MTVVFISLGAFGMGFSLGYFIGGHAGIRFAYRQKNQGEI